MSIVSWILSTGERMGSKFISKVFWPPCSSMTLVLEEDRLLVVRTEGYLMLPGGIMEEGEDFKDCAVRETREETGLQVEIIEEVESDVKDFGGVEKIFLAEKTGGELQGSWEGEPEYVEIDEALEEKWRWDRDIGKILDKANP